MTPQAPRLAQVLQQNVAVGRFPSQAPYFGADNTAPLWSSAQLADHLLTLADFRSLDLGGWRGVVADAVISEALELVLPMWMQPEFGLLFEAVKIAAQRQRGESWTRIGVGAAVSTLVGLFFAAVAKAE